MGRYIQFFLVISLLLVSVIGFNCLDACAQEPTPNRPWGGWDEFPPGSIPSVSIPSATNPPYDPDRPWGGWDEFPPGSIPSVTTAPVKK